MAPFVGTMSLYVCNTVVIIRVSRGFVYLCLPRVVSVQEYIFVQMSLTMTV